MYRKQGCLPLARVASQAGADYLCHGEFVQLKFMTSFSPLFKLCDGIEWLKNLIRSIINNVIISTRNLYIGYGKYLVVLLWIC